MSQERILVVLPTLGQRLDMLRQTFESIKIQTEVDHDIVMITPLGNQEAVNLGKEYGAEILDDPGSLSAAVNIGIKSAKEQHEYISWIGDDDLLRSHSLFTGIAELDKHQAAVLAFGYCDYIDEKGKVIFTNKAGKIAPWLMTWGPNLVPCPGAIFRKSAFDIVGLFDEDNQYCMDLDMLLRLRKVGKFINTKTVLAAFRWHSDSQTVSNRQKVLIETQEVKRKHLSPALRIFAPFWEPFVNLATNYAHRRVNKRTAQ